MFYFSLIKFIKQRKNKLTLNVFLKNKSNMEFGSNQRNANVLSFLKKNLKQIM